MKRRKLWALALTAAMVGSLTACGGGSKPAETTAAPAAATTAADNSAAADTQAPSGDGGSLVYLSLIHIQMCIRDRQKTIDGLENSIPVITSNKLYEVAKYFSKTEQFIIPDPILMSKAVYDSLTPEQQQDIDEAGKQMDIEWNEKIWPARCV